PVGVLLALAGGLDEVVDGTLGRDGPGAEQRLQHQVAVDRRRPRWALGGRLTVPAGVTIGDLEPLLDGADPGVGDLGEWSESGTHVLAALGVVGRRGQHRRRPLALAPAV